MTPSRPECAFAASPDCQTEAWNTVSPWEKCDAVTVRGTLGALPSPGRRASKCQVRESGWGVMRGTAAGASSLARTAGGARGSRTASAEATWVCLAASRYAASRLPRVAAASARSATGTRLASDTLRWLSAQRLPSASQLNR